jgi:hypothetical protein
MGYYVNENSKGEPLPIKGKANALIADGAKEVDGNEFLEDLVCVVGNGFFDAALYCYKEEYDYVKKYPDRRTKRWLVYEPAKRLSGFEKTKK